MYVWHVNVGAAGSNNEVNVLELSPLYHAIVAGIWPPRTMTFIVNNRTRTMAYYLADGIYPRYAFFATPYPDADTTKKRTYNRLQEALRTDVERLYAVLTGRFNVLLHPARFTTVEELRQVARAVTILYKIMVNRNRHGYVSVRRVAAGLYADVANDGADDGAADVAAAAGRVAADMHEQDPDPVQEQLTGTVVTYRPGLLVGGTLEHECHPARGLGYYLEALLMLAPFTKTPLDVTLRGETHTTTDLSVDSVASVSVPLLRRLTLGRVAPALRVVRRSAASFSGGQVVLTAKPARGPLPPVELLDAGLIKRVLGVAWANKVSPGEHHGVPARVRLGARRAAAGGGGGAPSPLGGGGGGGGGDGGAVTAGGGGGARGGAGLPPTPEAVARGAAHGLVEEVDGGGCVDSAHANLALLVAAASEADVSRVRLGRVGGASVAFLRDVRSFLGVVFHVRVERDERMDQVGGGGAGSDGEERGGGGKDAYVSGIVMKCVGVGLEGPRARS
ncbi:hypothetical protein BU14_0081s0006 [Porphyra umbilicalis]|uniref:RNA 3'-terminal phosphate cyclase domain-containing protein n=1 Tax=Porphyra umbilicalis TaxID=2786 RepID=A0A1X6PF18_PORUM|nr:hypothetical protein BU14_0081s0006 [Porphyra umbilicalis]|eukprot:OSX79326.1 hypothetical protein BU14_0081s0006 [Porphyra umbilicalis]